MRWPSFLALVLVCALPFGCSPREQDELVAQCPDKAGTYVFRDPATGRLHVAGYTLAPGVTAEAFCAGVRR